MRNLFKQMSKSKPTGPSSLFDPISDPETGHMALETLSAAQLRLADAGFTDNLIARDGHLFATPSRRTLDPADLCAAEVVRFEGNSDPDDQAILIAVTNGEGEPVGTFTAPYGLGASSDEAAVLRQLKTSSARH